LRTLLHLCRSPRHAQIEGNDDPKAIVVPTPPKLVLRGSTVAVKSDRPDTGAVQRWRE
jgi:hypothetical protein